MFIYIKKLNIYLINIYKNIFLKGLCRTHPQSFWVFPCTETRGTYWRFIFSSCICLNASEPWQVLFCQEIEFVAFIDFCCFTPVSSILSWFLGGIRRLLAISLVVLQWWGVGPGSLVVWHQDNVLVVWGARPCRANCNCPFEINFRRHVWKQGQEDWDKRRGWADPEEADWLHLHRWDRGHRGECAGRSGAAAPVENQGKSLKLKGPGSSGVRDVPRLQKVKGWAWKELLPVSV